MRKIATVLALGFMLTLAPSCADAAPSTASTIRVDDHRYHRHVRAMATLMRGYLENAEAGEEWRNMVDLTLKVDGLFGKSIPNFDHDWFLALCGLNPDDPYTPL